MKPVLLVMTDGSSASTRVLSHADRLARAGGMRIVLLRVLDPAAELHNVRPGDRDAVTRTLTASWQAHLEQLMVDRSIDGVTHVRLLGASERLDEAVTSAAREHDAIMLAMHSRGAGAVRHALLGSVALGVLGSTSLPVMMTGPEAVDPSHAATGYRLVVTSDGSAASNIIVLALSSLLPTLEGKVTLLHVCELRSGRADPMAEVAVARRQLESLRRLLPAQLDPEIDVSVNCDVGRVADDILGAAHRLHADAIALSTHGHSALRHLIAGSTALDLLARSPVPLILSRYPA